MMTYNTFCENNKTIRVWQESMGNKTLTRKFYVNYVLYVSVNGKRGTLVCGSKDEAKYKMKQWMQKVAKYRGFDIDKWYENKDTCITTECGLWQVSFKTGVSAYCYIHEEAGDLIEEKVA